MQNNERELDGRVAIVTGASRGIGAAIAQRLASAGATVACAARSITSAPETMPGTVEEVVARIEAFGGKAFAVECDVLSEASRAALIAAVIERCGRIDILVNNAGTSILRTLQEVDMAIIRQQTEMYFLAPIDLSLRAAEHMRRRGEGWIVNLGSSSAAPIDVAAAIAEARPQTLAYYAALKAGVHRMSTGFAVGLAPDNIAVNVVAPVAAVSTPGIRAQGIVTPENEHLMEPEENMAEATLALVCRPPMEQTGVIAFSYQYLEEIGRSTRTLDGSTVLIERRHGEGQR